MHRYSYSLSVADTVRRQEGSAVSRKVELVRSILLKFQQLGAMKNKFSRAVVFESQLKDLYGPVLYKLTAEMRSATHQAYIIF